MSRASLRACPFGVDHTVEITRSSPEEVVVVPVEHGLPPARPGDQFVLTTVSPLGLDEQVVAVQRAGARRWTLQPVSPATRVQRRAFARVAAARVAVVDHGGRPLRFGVVDLGEGGMRCAAADPPPFHVGDRVVARLDLDDQQLSVEAEVIRLEAGVRAGGSVAFRFVDLSSRDADTIRRFVFARQRLDRAKGLR